jgi:hypothetical protein
MLSCVDKLFLRLCTAEAAWTPAELLGDGLLVHECTLASLVAASWSTLGSDPRRLVQPLRLDLEVVEQRIL